MMSVQNLLIEWVSVRYSQIKYSLLRLPAFKTYLSVPYELDILQMTLVGDGNLVMFGV